MSLRDKLRRAGLTRNRINWVWKRPIAEQWFLRPSMSPQNRRAIVLSGDPVRYGNMMLSLEQISEDKISGAIAECGVFRGQLSKFILQHASDRKLYLFDTFAGFDSRDSNTAGDVRFQGTSEQEVCDYIGDLKNVVIRKGFFPETAAGLEDERFAFVVCDFDKYEPTLAALEFFYYRVNPGGFIFVHDYSSPESNWACSRALDSFLSDKPEHPILLPDTWGTALFRKY